jgi:hypothetical protein
VKKTQKQKNGKTNSPLVLESLVSKLQHAYDKKGSGSTIPTKETRTIATQED